MMLWYMYALWNGECNLAYALPHTFVLCFAGGKNSEKMYILAIS